MGRSASYGWDQRDGIDISGERSPAMEQVINAWGGFSASTNYLHCSNGEGLRGSATAYWFGTIIHTHASLSGDILCSASLTNSRGWQLFAQSATELRFRHYNGAAAAVNVTLAVPGTLAGRTHVVMGWYDGSNIQIMVDGTESGTVAAVGYTAPVAGDHMDVGVRGNHGSAFNGHICGVVGADGSSPSSGERTQWLADVKNFAVPAVISGKTDHQWYPIPLTDRVGSEDLTEFGSVTDIALAPVWNY